MSDPAHTPEPRLGAEEIVRRFAYSIAGLIEVMGAVFNPHPNPPVPGQLLWGYFLRTSNRFSRLIARLAAQTRPCAATKATAVALATAKAPPREPTERKNPRLRLPRKKMWLRALLGWRAGGCATQIEHLLNQPETAALIANSPQAQRLLRPLCHMLGITPASIPKLPPRPRKPRPNSAPKPKPPTRAEREAILWYPNLQGKPMRLLPRRTRG